MEEIILEDELDKLFPKGDKRRGDALVLYAFAQILIDNELKKFLKWVSKYSTTDFYSRCGGFIDEYRKERKGLNK